MTAKHYCIFAFLRTLTCTHCASMGRSFNFAFLSDETGEDRSSKFGDE